MLYKKLYFFGFTLWKRNNVKYFFRLDDTYKIYFCSNKKEAIKKGLGDANSEVFIWGKRDFKDIEFFCKQHNIQINRVEDGFVRSFSLGSDLTKAYSLVVDSRGIYFDPTISSDLEYILQTYNLLRQ